jgi:hypothetical protein
MTELTVFFAIVLRKRRQTDYSRLTTKKNLKDTEKTASDEKKVVTSWLRTVDCDVYKPCCHGERNASVPIATTWKSGV